MRTTQYTLGKSTVQLTWEDVRRARQTARVTKKQLAEWLHISRPTLDRLENGSPTRPGLLQRALHALQVRGPVLNTMAPMRSVKAARCPPDWLVLLLTLADECSPELESVQALLSAIKSLLGMPVSGLSLKEIPSSAELFNIRVAAIAKENPNWLQEVMVWLAKGADSGRHPLFRKAMNDVANVRRAINQGKTVSQAFGIASRGRPPGKAKGLTYMTKQFSAKDDAIRLAHLLILNGKPKDQAIDEAASICYGSRATAPLLQRQLTQARRTKSPLVQAALQVGKGVLIDVPPVSDLTDGVASPAEVSVEIRAIISKYPN